MYAPREAVCTRRHQCRRWVSLPTPTKLEVSSTWRPTESDHFARVNLCDYNTIAELLLSLANYRPNIVFTLPSTQTNKYSSAISFIAYVLRAGTIKIPKMIENIILPISGAAIVQTLSSYELADF